MPWDYEQLSSIDAINQALWAIQQSIEDSNPRCPAAIGENKARLRCWLHGPHGDQPHIFWDAETREYVKDD